MKVFIRKDANRNQPFCIGELRFFENIMIFTVPYCQPMDDSHESLDIALENYIRGHYPNTPLKDEAFIEEDKDYPCQHLIVDPITFQKIKDGESVNLPIIS